MPALFADQTVREAAAGQGLAIRFADGTVAAVFHAPSGLDGFTTDSPDVFLIHENMVFVAAPSQQLKTMTITYRDAARHIDLLADDFAGTTAVLVF